MTGLGEFCSVLETVSSGGVVTLSFNVVVGEDSQGVLL